MSLHPSVLAVKAYKAAHPEVDFKGQTVRLTRTADGGYEATGHEPTDPKAEAMLNSCCCHPWLPRHHAPIEEES